MRAEEKPTGKLPVKKAIKQVDSVSPIPFHIITHEMIKQYKKESGILWEKYSKVCSPKIAKKYKMTISEEKQLTNM